MGIGTNILIFMVILNIVFYILNIDTSLTLITKFITGNASLNQVEISSELVLAILTITATTSIFAYISGFFSNISLAVLMSFLLSFATFPLSVFNSQTVTFEFKLLVGGVLSILYLISLISFVRGGEL